MSPEERDALIAYRLAKARETLDEARVQIDNELWRLAANRYYFAAFHAVSALLNSRDEYPKTHKGVRQRFGLLFVTTGQVPARMSDLLSELFDLRNSGDYDDLISVDREMAVRLGPETEELIEMVKVLIAKPLGQ